MKLREKLIKNDSTLCKKIKKKLIDERGSGRNCLCSRRFQL